MIVTELIEDLKVLGDISKPIFASLEADLAKKLYVDLFVNSNGLPAISTSEEEPLPFNKKGNILLQELQTWEKESIHYDSKSDVYLITNYEYDDGSYDFRYFKLKAISDEGDNLILIARPDECIELREHHDAFDDSMLAED